MEDPKIAEDPEGAAAPELVVKEKHLGQPSLSPDAAVPLLDILPMDRSQAPVILLITSSKDFPMPTLTARRAFDLAMTNDWQQFAAEFVIPRERFIELQQRFTPEDNAEQAYATMVAKLRQGFDKISTSATKWLGIKETASRVKNELEISKVYVMWDTLSGAPHTEDFTVIALDDRHYIVDLD
jgi:hypothetical protein